MFKKNALSSVVATALLLVVAVMSVISFQTFFQSYSSNVFTNIEQES